MNEKSRTAEHRIFCVDCGSIRIVKTQNWKQVKRCIPCQYAEKQAYNTRYTNQKRRENKIDMTVKIYEE